MGNTTQSIEIDKLRRDGATQPRADLNMDAVRDYAEALRDGAVFPPVRVFFDGKDHWLSHGFHRTAACEMLGRTEIDAEILPGTLWDAQWDSFSANKENRLRRLSDDVRRVLFKIFSDPRWKDKSQREIADHVGVRKTKVFYMLKAFRDQNGQESGPRAGPSPINKGTGKQAAQVPAPADPDPKPPGPGRSQGTEATPTPTPTTAGNDDTMQAFNAGVDRVVSILRQAYGEFSRLTNYTGKKEGNRFQSKWAQSYSPMGTLGVISTLCRSLEEGMPAELFDRHPGYRTVAQVRSAADLTNRKVG